MKVLIAGASGQLGRALVATAPAGAALPALDRAALDLGSAGSIAATAVATRYVNTANASGSSSPPRASVPDSRSSA